MMSTRVTIRICGLVTVRVAGKAAEELLTGLFALGTPCVEGSFVRIEHARSS